MLDLLLRLALLAGTAYGVYLWWRSREPEPELGVDREARASVLDLEYEVDALRRRVEVLERRTGGNAEPSPDR